MDLVTGGTGFIGAHIVRALLRKGRSVRCAVRATSDRRNLSGLDVEIVVADLDDPDAWNSAVFTGCSRVFHCAADYRLWARDPSELYRANVDGTERVLRGAARAGVERVVYTSSVGALGLRDDGTPADERTPIEERSIIGDYKRSKFLAERVAERWARELDVVIVNPSTPIGELDVKPTPTGRIIVDFLCGRTPAYVDTGLNLVDVRDVALGHLLAAERGASGEKYIVGGENLSLKAIFERLARLSGRKAPSVRVPHALPLAYAAISTAWARVRDRPPRIPLDAVRMSQKKMFFASDKAKRELGYSPAPVDDALARAIDFFRSNGYAS